MLSLILLLSIVGLSNANENFNENANENENENFNANKFKQFIELTDTNHVTLRGPVNEASVSQLIVNMSNIDNDSIILYLSSPGGSVIAGQHLIQYIDYLKLRGKTFHCVADYAASMAFDILQSCDYRYVTPSSILMQHQMSYHLHGQYFNVRSHQRLIDAMASDMVKRDAKRMGLTEEEFINNIKSDWWFLGAEAVASNAADELIHVGCAPNLFETTLNATEYVCTIFGDIPIKVVYSSCPLVREPLEYTVESKLLNNLSAIDQIRAHSEIHQRLTRRFNLRSDDTSIYTMEPMLHLGETYTFPMLNDDEDEKPDTDTHILPMVPMLNDDEDEKPDTDTLILPMVPMLNDDEDEKPDTDTHILPMVPMLCA